MAAQGLQIIGAGFGRTGTLSLKKALETLGFDKCYHMAEVAAHPKHVKLWRAAWRGEDPWAQLSPAIERRWIGRWRRSGRG